MVQERICGDLLICSRRLLFINSFIYFNDYYFINFNYLSNKLFEISTLLREVILPQYDYDGSPDSTKQYVHCKRYFYMYLKKTVSGWKQWFWLVKYIHRALAIYRADGSTFWLPGISRVRCTHVFQLRSLFFVRSVRPTNSVVSRFKINFSIFTVLSLNL